MAAVAANTVLTELDLSDNEISSEACAELGALLKHTHPSLKIVRLGKNLIDEGAAEAMCTDLKAYVPTLTVDV